MSESHGKNIIPDDTAAKNKPKLRAGDIVRVCGDAAELWIAGYNVRVDTYATVDTEPSKGAKKVLVTLDSIDGDSKVCTYVRRSKVKVEFNIVRATFGSVWDRGEVVETPCMVNLETKEVLKDPKYRILQEQRQPRPQTGTNQGTNHAENRLLPRYIAFPCKLAGCNGSSHGRAELIGSNGVMHR